MSYYCNAGGGAFITLREAGRVRYINQIVRRKAGRRCGVELVKPYRFESARILLK
jgi:hypothetical protein